MNIKENPYCDGKHGRFWVHGHMPEQMRVKEIVWKEAVNNIHVRYAEIVYKCPKCNELKYYTATDKNLLK